MGTNPSRPEGASCVPIQGDDGDSPIYVSSHRVQEPVCIDTFPSLPEADNLVKIVESCANKFEGKKSMGERKINPNGSFGEYQWLSYRQLYNKTLSFAAALQKKGIKKGDLVGIFSHNCVFWHISEFAIHLCGAVVVPISDRLGPDTSRDILKDSGTVDIERRDALCRALDRRGALLQQEMASRTIQNTPQPQVSATQDWEPEL